MVKPDRWNRLNFSVKNASPRKKRCSWVVVSTTFYFRPEYLGKWCPFWRCHIFQMGGFNYQVGSLRFFLVAQHEAASSLRLWKQTYELLGDWVGLQTWLGFFQRDHVRGTPSKTNMTGWNTYHEWRCIFLLKMGILQLSCWIFHQGVFFSENLIFFLTKKTNNNNNNNNLAILLVTCLGWWVHVTLKKRVFFLGGWPPTI